MAITIDHALLPAHDHEESARRFARIMGRTYAGSDRHFARVRINDTFSVVFMHTEAPCGIHLGFHVGGAEVATILANLHPPAPERREILEDGQEYTVQYFERVRLERRPERAPHGSRRARSDQWVLPALHPAVRREG